MAAPIGPGHGIDAARLRLIEHDPDGAEAYKKLMSPVNPTKGYEGTMHKLVQGHNDIWGEGGLEDRLAALEDAVRRGPFG